MFGVNDHTKNDDADSNRIAFDTWNEQKKVIDAQTNELTNFPRAGEVWMCVLGKNIGFEQNGGGDNFSRPVLIVKKFNNRMFWAVPLSTKQKPYDFYFNFTDPEGNGVAAVLAQMRIVSIHRIGRKMYTFESDMFSSIKQAIMGLVG